ncbi:MAG: hypothetical protein EOO43_19285 [Flavobacterium sp.]|nr:MAG: hypothetical protein EOO43_19285 [Flavobacterium sp.]
MCPTKEKRLFIHNPSTLETLYCLRDSPFWAEKLLDDNYGHKDFLKDLIAKNFYQSEDSPSIKFIASDLSLTATKVSKWIKDIYNDILLLNQLNPEMFRSAGTEHLCHFRNYDNHQSFSVWLTQTPRNYENVDLYFLKAKMGTDTFMVTEVSHSFFDNRQVVILTLKGGYCNRYREELVQRALFEGVLGFMDTYKKSGYEIDEILRKHYSGS